MRQTAFLCAAILATALGGMVLPAHSQQAQREHAAATRSQTQKTDRVNQDATVHDETSGASEGAQPARAASPNVGAGNGKPAAPSYGPVLNPRQPQATDPARKDPAEVQDETDSLSRQPAQPQQQKQAEKQKQAGKQKQQAARRRQAWQPEAPMAPRPLSSGNTAAIGTGMVPVPPPAQPPQPVVPSSRALNSCVGGACTDAAGGTYNMGPTGVGVSSSGRLCSTSGTTVQCF